MVKKVLISSSLALFILTGCSSKNEVSIVEQDNKYGAIENSGKVVTKPVYEELTWFDDANNKNLKLSHPNYFNFHWFHNYAGEEYAIAKQNGKYGIIDKENNVLIKPMYDSISKLFNGFAVIKQDSKYGYINEDLEIVQKPLYTNAQEFLDEVTFVQDLNKKWGCITKEMDLKIKPMYDEVYNFKDGMARVKKDDKWGYVNNSCEQVVKPVYEYAYEFANGYAKVLKDGKIAFINEEGKEITKAVFQSAGNF